ncbi:hypothetical protein, partial [Dactylosporangium sp. NPDC000521]|uniref:hypothetical protein n=1 Tax=Dactylosporangium sp. NPDC000521 TaxID=3363975 RepID=UPI0036C67DA8
MSAPLSGPAPCVAEVDWAAVGAARCAAAAEEFRRRREARSRAKAEFAEARTHGLAARHATKLARLRNARTLTGEHQPHPPATRPTTPTGARPATPATRPTT